MEDSALLSLRQGELQQPSSEAVGRVGDDVVSSLLQVE